MESSILFMKEVAKYPLLSKAETNELIIQAQNGDEEALNKVVNSNLKLVVNRTKYFIDKGVDFMDLVDEGALGLKHAIEKFDTSKGNAFSTYATVWIDKYMRNEIIKNGRAIAIPAHIQEKASKICKAKERFLSEYDREPSSEELSDYLGDISAEDIDFINQIYYQTNLDSLDREVFEDTPMYEVVSSDENYEEDSYQTNSQNSELMKMLDQLDERESYVIKHTFGVFDDDEETFEQVGNDLGISAERVRQIRKDALNYLRANFTDPRVCD